MLILLLACQQAPKTATDTASSDEGCPVTLTYTAQGGERTSAVRLDGELEGQLRQDGEQWAITLNLEPGLYPYTLVETVDFSQASEERPYCDPAARQIHCAEGYKEPWENVWAQDCTTPDPACESLLVVPDCEIPSLSAQEIVLSEDRERLSIQIAAAGSIAQAQASWNGEALEAWTGSGFQVDLSGLEPGRHTFRFRVTDDQGRQSEELWIPLWTDAEAEQGWRAGSLYFAFVDRLWNGDTANDDSEGTSVQLGDYMGGDWAGVRAMLPYLDDLGVRTIWLSNPQDNASGAWAGSCEQTYSGYHAYWPSAARQVEGHFGTEEELVALVDDAHARGMRVIMDWVGNHLHESHPWVAAHPEWFNSEAMCDGTTNGQENWTAIPERCWFAPYLPDIDYGQPAAMQAMLDEAIWWARTYDLDGFRVDAVKHMPHSVAWNLRARVQDQIEHGGPGDFWTIGETFDGADPIQAYLGADQLHGQFDFPLYWAIRSSLASGSSSMRDLSSTMQDGASRYAGSRMSVFLGNHDIARFSTEAAEGGRDICDGDPLAQASGPWDGGRALQSLALSWVFVLTRPEVPLVYYGDELGLPGYGDPDNRQPFWWLVPTLPGSVAEAAAQVDADRAEVLRTVQLLSQARAEHPALWSGDEVEWWLDDTVLAWARSTDESHVLVVLNAGEEARELTNGLSFAGLPEGGVWREVLSGGSVVAEGDSITVRVEARTGGVWVRE